MALFTGPVSSGTHQQFLAHHDLRRGLYRLQYADDSRREALPDPDLSGRLQYGD